jgi:hypothetical protein
MTAQIRTDTWRSLLWILLALVLLQGLAGCQTRRIDWQSRIGSYHYDDAVREFGPPDKQAVLSDGTRVAEWLTVRGRRGGLYAPSPWAYSYGPGYYGYPPAYHYYDPPSPDWFIRLTFGPDGILRAAQRFVR